MRPREGEGARERQRGDLHTPVHLAERDEGDVGRLVDGEADGVLQRARRRERQLGGAAREAELRRERADAEGRRSVDEVEDRVVERRRVGAAA